MILLAALFVGVLVFTGSIAVTTADLTELLVVVTSLALAVIAPGADTTTCDGSLIGTFAGDFEVIIGSLSTTNEFNASLEPDFKIDALFGPNIDCLFKSL